MSEYLTTLDELIRTMCEDPSTIETREVAPDMVWAFVPRQVAIDDWDEYGVVLTCKRFDALMAQYAGIDATAPEDDEVPA